MGGRKAHMNRKNGQIDPKGYYAVGVFDVKVDGKNIQAKLIEANVKITDGARGMPAYSNSPNSIYVMVNREGTVERVRVYDKKCVGILDLDLHGDERKHIEPFPHEHTLTYDTAGRLHDGSHQQIGKEHHEKYRELIELLGKKPEGYRKFKKRT